MLLVLLLALLAACGPKEAEDPSGISASFTFTRENLPRLDGSTSTAPLAQSMCAVLLGESREDVSDLVQFSRTTQSYRNLMEGKADLLLAADLQGIAAAGYNTITPVVVTNADEYAEVSPQPPCEVAAGDTIIKLE